MKFPKALPSDLASSHPVKVLKNVETFMQEYSQDFEKLRDVLHSEDLNLRSLIQDCTEQVAKPGKVLVVEALMLQSISSVRDNPSQRDAFRAVLVDQVNTVHQHVLGIAEKDIQPTLWAEGLKTLGR